MNHSTVSADQHDVDITASMMSGVACRLYHLTFCELGRLNDAKQAYEQALALAKQQPERRFLAKRLQELG